MNYGYECKGWSAANKERLAADLSEMVQGYLDAHGMRPYVELDELYRGVRVRRITHLTEEQQDELVERADEIYTTFLAARSRS